MSDPKRPSLLHHDSEKQAWDECQKGTRVRFALRDDRLVFTPGPRSGEGVVALIWNCQGEPCWDVLVTPSYEEAIYGGSPEDVHVGVFPGFGDTITPVGKGTSPDTTSPADRDG